MGLRVRSRITSQSLVHQELVSIGVIASQSANHLSALAWDYRGHNLNNLALLYLLNQYISFWDFYPIAKKKQFAYPKSKNQKRIHFLDQIPCEKKNTNLLQCV